MASGKLKIAALTAVATICGLLLMLPKLFPGLRPGTNTGFDSQSSATTTASVIELRLKKHGAAESWLELTLDTGEREVEAIKAELNGETLRVEDTNPAPGSWKIQVCKSTEKTLQPFEWSTGIPLKVSILGADPAASESKLRDWQVHLKESAPDSRKSRLTRRLSHWVLVVALFLSGLGALLTPFLQGKDGGKGKRSARPTSPPAPCPEGEDPQGRLTAESCARRIIARMKGVDDEDTARIQSFLTKVVFDRDAVGPALAAVGVPSEKRRVFHRTASFRFQRQVTALVTDLGRFPQRLEWPAGPR